MPFDTIKLRIQTDRLIRQSWLTTIESLEALVETGTIESTMTVEQAIAKMRSALPEPKK